MIDQVFPINTSVMPLASLKKPIGSKTVLQLPLYITTYIDDPFYVIVGLYLLNVKCEQSWAACVVN